MISYWGVDHGSEVSKAKNDKYGGHGAPSGGRRAAAYFFGPAHGAVAGKKGKKLRTMGNQLVGSYGGGMAGAGVGSAVGTVLGRGRPAVGQAGASVGQLAGAVTGSQVALNRVQRKGYLKRES